MKNLRTVSYLNIATLAQQLSQSTADVQQYLVKRNDLGEMEARHVVHPHVTIVEFKTNTHEPFCVQYDEAQMHHSMNVCFAIEGTVGLQLKESKFSTSLSEHQHHFIYSPESRYDIVTTKNVHGFHLSIDLDYYTDLLSEREAFTSDVRSKLLKKETAWAGKGSMNLNMKQALQDIVHNPLAGNIRSLLIEAKVLELVALQLNQFSAGEKACPAKRAETEAFYALKEYLDQHFADDLSLRGLSRTFGMNEFKLKKGFKELFNNTIFEYIHDLKMTYARELLLDHKKYVNEVSSLVGYKNPNHFSTAFKRKFGTSPSALK